MPIKPRDPLLAAAQFVLTLSMALILLSAAAFLLGVPAVLIMRDTVVDALVERGFAPELVPAILAVLSLLAAASVLGFFFLRHLRRIVATVGEGDPFVPVNAARLRAMAWLSLGTNGLLVAVAVVVGLARVDRQGSGDLTFTLGGILLALVLFVLARVFREGTRLREELEGTV